MRKVATTVATLAVAALMGTLFHPAAAVAASPGGSGKGPSGLDARAAAGVSAETVKSESIGIQASWYSGTVAAGGTQYWFWNNANPLTAAYKVGFSPLGASTTAACQFEVTRSWYVQQYGGEREFHFTIRNSGSIACAANILLSSLNAGTSWSTGGVNPGASQSWTWNNNPANLNFLVGLSPAGATNTATCQFEVTRSWYEKRSSGEREFHFVVKNVGTIACVADIRLAWTSTGTTWTTSVIGPGASQTGGWNNANPLNTVYLVGFNPIGSNCALEATREWYVQRINSDGSTEREYYFTIRNAGSIACSGIVLLAGIAA
jgi:hypothetical protein